MYQVILIIILLASSHAFSALTSSGYMRPTEITTLKPSDDIYYFGVGSNMLKDKLVNRGMNNSKIEIKSFEAAVVKGYRLAFNMRGFPPFEPGMGALEPITSNSDSTTTATTSISNSNNDESPQLLMSECHGSLCKMTRENYEKVWVSEGGGSETPGYEEIVVDAYKYTNKGISNDGVRISNDGVSRIPVKAISLRARPHTRMTIDASPSERYMKILITGAQELGLEASYINMLKSIPTQKTTKLIKILGLNYFYFAGLLFRKPKLRKLTKPINYLLWKSYIPSSRKVTVVRRLISNVLMSFTLLPGACIGVMIRIMMKIMRKPTPPMLKAMFKSTTSDSNDKDEVINKNNKEKITVSASSNNNN